MTDHHEIDAAYSFEPANRNEVILLLEKVVGFAAQEDGADLSLKVDDKTQKATLSLYAKTESNLARILHVIGPHLTDLMKVAKLASVDCFGPTPPALKSSLGVFKPTFAAARP